jgi:cytochrome oxidase Cu insertion factor (SCO1/SenC/PrrC family)
MPGMNSGLDVTNPVLVAAFRAALLHQGLIVLALLAVLSVAWAGARLLDPAGRAGSPVVAEAAGRRLLRVSFGILWIFDGLLQAQPAMAAGLPSDVIQPTAASSPAWVQHVVNWAGTTWSYHPIQAGAAAVWIQVGIGAWLLAAPRGTSSRLAGLASAGWGLVVWVFGEAFGGIFAPGLTWLFGAPGAVVFYCVAGALVAAPERYWRTPELGRKIVAGMGLFFAGMAVLQAWPGRGFWAGSQHGRPGTLAGMVQSMAGTHQPALFAGWVAGFASFSAAHGFAVNLVAVIALAAIGAGLLIGQGLPLRLSLIIMIALCLADWVLIEDFGFFGGLGTDPNSMLPILALASGGYLALTHLPAPAPAALPATAPATGPANLPGTGPAGLVRSLGSAGSRAILATWAVAILLVGAAPMALAQVRHQADPIIAQAIDGNSAPLNFAAPAFGLTDQDGRPVSLASLHGKVVLLTFLDPVCTTDCPLIAQEFRAADQLLGARSRNVELVAIATNPVYYSLSYVRAFNQEEHLGGLPNWHFLTGPLAQLKQAWRQYGIAAQIVPSGGMIAHNDVAYVIDAAGRTRTELDFDPGPGTASSESSFAAELSQAAERLMKSS